VVLNAVEDAQQEPVGVDVDPVSAVEDVKVETFKDDTPTFAELGVDRLLLVSLRCPPPSRRCAAAFFSLLPPSRNAPSMVCVCAPSR